MPNKSFLVPVCKRKSLTRQIQDFHLTKNSISEKIISSLLSFVQLVLTCSEGRLVSASSDALCWRWKSNYS
jgi:hypothetical protein